ncbi:MAG: helix-turn-helix transcriptional regulator [Clostridia bacterium]|nr:helix-turn-helix transcriptional regulator [Clostridia bacterium]
MNRIRDLREDMDLRQIDVSVATGIDQKTLSNYETGKTNPDSFSIIKLADFFNVSCDYLLGRTDEEKSDYDDLINRIEKIQNELDKIKKEIRKM